MNDSIWAPYLIFLGDEQDSRIAKTGSGLFYWAKDRCLAQIRLPGAKADIGLPDMSINEAVKAGARTLVLGVAPAGGQVPKSWLPTIELALRSGMDIVSGMHADLEQIESIRGLAERAGRRLIDIRKAPEGLPVGNGVKRKGMRLITVGTDCGVGKMYAALAIHRELQQAGADADFRATGQTGKLIAGDGICIDAVVADFMAGAAELLSPDNTANHWDIIEGQGSLHHPAYAGVSLALLHGSQPDVIVMCHDASRELMVGLKGRPVPSIEASIELNLQCARIVNSSVRVGGVCANTSAMSESDANDWMTDTQRKLQVPVCDPVRTGVSSIVKEINELCAA